MAAALDEGPPVENCAPRVVQMLEAVGRVHEVEGGRLERGDVASIAVGFVEDHRIGCDGIIGGADVEHATAYDRALEIAELLPSFRSLTHGAKPRPVSDTARSRHAPDRSAHRGPAAAAGRCKRVRDGRTDPCAASSAPKSAATRDR